jgi:hypothetical protein
VGELALYTSLVDLAAGIEEMGSYPAVYFEKMMHRVPPAAVVDRNPWLVATLTGKTIFHIGCVGPLHEKLLKVCPKAYGMDHETARYPNFVCLDIENMRMPLPRYDDVEVILLGEILEHLLAPGMLLLRVRDVYPEIPVIITVPNAASEALQSSLKRGYESVNLDHTCWFSWHTLKVLIEKCGYTLQEWYWYGGRPLFAEGLIFVVR